MKAVSAMVPPSQNSLATSPMRRMFSARSAAENPRFLFRPWRMLSPSSTNVCLPRECSRWSTVLATVLLPQALSPVNQSTAPLCALSLLRSALETLCSCQVMLVAFCSAMVLLSLSDWTVKVLVLNQVWPPRTGRSGSVGDRFFCGATMVGERCGGGKPKRPERAVGQGRASPGPVGVGFRSRRGERPRLAPAAETHGRRCVGRNPVTVAMEGDPTVRAIARHGFVEAAAGRLFERHPIAAPRFEAGGQGVVDDLLADSRRAHGHDGRRIVARHGCGIAHASGELEGAPTRAGSRGKLAR